MLPLSVYSNLQQSQQVQKTGWSAAGIPRAERPVDQSAGEALYI
jgi:hypothetical protein